MSSSFSDGNRSLLSGRLMPLSAHKFSPLVLSPGNFNLDGIRIHLKRHHTGHFSVVKPDRFSGTHVGKNLW